MKIGQTAKQIDAIVNPLGRYSHNKPEYFGCCTTWNDKRSTWNKVDATFVARKYSQIVDMVRETQAKVFVEAETLVITYSTGTAKIAIDELVKTVLIPELKTITAIN